MESTWAYAPNLDANGGSLTLSAKTPCPDGSVPQLVVDCSTEDGLSISLRQPECFEPARPVVSVVGAGWLPGILTRWTPDDVDPALLRLVAEHEDTFLHVLLRDPFELTIRLEGRVLTFLPRGIEALAARIPCLRARLTG